MTACITDREPEGFVFDIEDEPFDQVIWSDELPFEDIRGWIFKHDVVEFCTAIKGPVLDRLTQTDAEKIFYLDPDIGVMGSLQPMVDMLDDHSILLTPHQVQPDDERIAILDNEICSLRLGTYNLGFIAIRNDESGRRFASWWSNRLRDFCYDDLPAGLFVDQKWCDLVPALFDRVHIVHDPGYNVASWNISQRKIEIDHDGNITVNGYPLRFFHFTKLGPIGDTMTKRYARGNTAVFEIWSWYKRMVDRFDEPAIPKAWWLYGMFDNGVPIPKSVRVLYRQRADLQEAFPNPYEIKDFSYYTWLKSEGHM